MIHPTDNPNVMIISSKRGIGNTTRRSFNNSVIEQPNNEKRLVAKPADVNNLPKPESNLSEGGQKP